MNKPSSWSQSGPLLLLGAFAVLVYKSAPSFWPLLITALVGYSACIGWKKKGLYYSIALLMAAAFFTISRGATGFWTSMLSLSIGCSWLLILLGKQEMDQFYKETEALEEQLRQAAKLHAEQHKEKEHLNRHYAATAQALEGSEREKEQLNQRSHELGRQVLQLQHALEDEQAQLSHLKNQQNPPVVKQEEDPEEKLQLSQVHRQLALLREQFEEKSDTLDKTRKELFHIENEFLALQKSQEEKALEAAEENLILVKDLNQFEEERRDLETQVQNLQEIITILQTPKKRVVRTRKLKVREDLPDLIQDKIDQVNSVKTS
jgi:hypothetical protein